MNGMRYTESLMSNVFQPIVASFASNIRDRSNRDTNACKLVRSGVTRKCATRSE